MPLVIFSREFKDNALLGVWKATETTENLVQLADLKPEERNRLHAIRLEKRQREWLASRILLKMMSRGAGLDFLPNGKPILQNSTHISISHSQELAGVVIGASPIGMDIQGEDSKLLRIEGKFTNEKEYSFLPQDPSRLAYLTIIWSAKEAVFKYFGEQVDFRKDMCVQPFQTEDARLFVDYAGIHGKCTFELEKNRFESVHIITTTKPVNF